MLIFENNVSFKTKEAYEGKKLPWIFLSKNH